MLSNPSPKVSLSNFKDFTVDEMKKASSSLSYAFSSGDKIPTKALKFYSRCWIPIVAFLCNRSIDSCIFPSFPKDGFVLPQPQEI